MVGTRGERFSEWGWGLGRTSCDQTFAFLTWGLTSAGTDLGRTSLLRDGWVGKWPLGGWGMGGVAPGGLKPALEPKPMAKHTMKGDYCWGLQSHVGEI